MATNPTLLTMPIAENGQKNTIPATQAAAGDGLLSQSTGFPPETALPLGAGGKAPTREDFNGALNLLSDIAFYAQKGWFFQFDDTQDYFEGCVVRDTTDGVLYEAINDVAAGGSVPSSDSDNWKKFFPVGKTIGEIFPYAGTSQPPGALLCNGAAVSRTMYPDLFDEIGTTYGSGDGSTTFNLPNLVDKFIEGDLTSGTVKAAGLPNIKGNARLRGGSSALALPDWAGDDALYGDATGSTSTYLTAQSATGSSASRVLRFDASRSSAIYGNSNTVQPPALTMRYYIQAFNASTDPALVDLTQIVQDLANKLTREQTPAFNKRDVVTVSGTYTAPVTGWYKITVKGGGGGGGGGNKTTTHGIAGAGGGEGGTTIGYEKLTAGQTVSVIIGAGGAGGAANGGVGGNGGDSTVTVNSNTYTGGGGGGAQYSGVTGGVGGSGDIVGASAESSVYAYQQTGYGRTGAGVGGGPYGESGTLGGGGSGGNGTYNGTPSAGKAGGDGYAEFSYFLNS